MVRSVNDTEIRLMVPHDLVEWIRAEIEAAPSDECYREAFDEFVRHVLQQYRLHGRAYGVTIEVSQSAYRAARSLEAECDLPIAEAETRAVECEQDGLASEARHWWAVWRFLMEELAQHPHDRVSIKPDPERTGDSS